MQLNEEQEKAASDVLKWLQSDQPVFVLTGYAGTGKTTTVQAVVKRSSDLTICLSAPTHKAVGVLAAKSNIPGGDCRTIHSLLGCRMRWVEDKRVFEPNPDRWHWDNYDLVVLDEVSMVGDTIWSWVKEAQDTQRRRGQPVTKVLCLGDPAQLPPVDDGDGASPAFAVIDSTAHLTTIMRHQGVIERAATKVREHLGDVTPVFVEEGCDDGLVKKVRGRDAFFDKWDDVRQKTDDVIILSWRNTFVDWFNDACRKRVFGDDVPDIPQHGEIRVMKDTHSIDGGLEFIYTGEQLEIYEAEQWQHMGIPCWKVNTSRGEFHALRPDTQARWIAEKNKARRAKDWSKFRQLEEGFCVLRPGYATTVHKSQGSTYNTVFAVEHDIAKCPDHLTRNMLRYVAYTRASDALYII